VEPPERVLQLVGPPVQVLRLVELPVQVPQLAEPSIPSAGSAGCFVNYIAPCALRQRPQSIGSAF
jgi:hypothetical protein